MGASAILPPSYSLSSGALAQDDRKDPMMRATDQTDVPLHTISRGASAALTPGLRYGWDGRKDDHDEGVASLDLSCGGKPPLLRTPPKDFYRA